MERLTIKELHLVKDQNKANQKLSDLEDIEEELGMSLTTYFKIKVGIKVYTNLLLGTDAIIDNIFGSGKDTLYHIVRVNSRSGGYVKLAEYGITWALTKGELEK